MNVARNSGRQCGRTRRTIGGAFRAGSWLVPDNPTLIVAQTSVKPISRSQWNGGFGAHSGPSRGAPRRRAFRPKRTCIPLARTSRPLRSVATRTLPPEGRHILVVRFAVVAEIEGRWRTTRFRSTGATGADELRPGQREIRKRGRAWQRARTYGASKNESMDWARQPSDRSSVRHSMSLGSVTGRPRSEGRRALAYAIKS
jgi:hypothetical protein